MGLHLSILIHPHLDANECILLHFILLIIFAKIEKDIAVTIERIHLVSCWLFMI